MQSILPMVTSRRAAATWRTCNLYPAQLETLKISGGFNLLDTIDPFVQAVWSVYEKHAFGHDELTPLTLQGQDNGGGLGMMILESLDTLKMMGHNLEYLRWVALVIICSDIWISPAEAKFKMWAILQQHLCFLSGYTESCCWQYYSGSFIWT